MKRYYYLYKIANLINNKIYIGVHATNNLDDGYMGSGKVLKRAKNKYGIENFEKEILQYFDSVEEMYDAESILVDEKFVKDSNTYNLKEGGQGGWDHQITNIDAKRRGALESNKVLRERLKNDEAFRKAYIKKSVDRLLQYHKEGRFTYDNFRGKKHSSDSKEKIGKANSKHQSGSGNSQFGTMWIHNLDLKESKRISKDDPIPEGWKKGRKLKF